MEKIGKYRDLSLDEASDRKKNYDDDEKEKSEENLNNLKNVIDKTDVFFRTRYANAFDRVVADKEYKIKNKRALSYYAVKALAAPYV